MILQFGGYLSHRILGNANPKNFRFTKLVKSWSISTSNYSNGFCGGRAMSGGKIGIVGCGGVGSACASSLIHVGRGCVRSVTLFDADKERCSGEVMDLAEQANFHGISIHHAFDISTLKGSDIIVFAAGAKCLPGETRTALANRNSAILHKIVTEMVQVGVIATHTIIIVATNPVDALTAVLTRWLKPYVRSNQIIGSGTYIDSQRLRVLLSKRLSVPPRLVHAYVLGEHGDSQVASYNMVTVGTSSLQHVGLSSTEFMKLTIQTRQRAQEIVHRKGNTRHCIGQCVASICCSILEDGHDVLPVSVLVPAYQCVFGWPAVVQSMGIGRLLPVEIGIEDHERLKASANSINVIVNTLMLRYPKLGADVSS